MRHFSGGKVEGAVLVALDTGRHLARDSAGDCRRITDEVVVSGIGSLAKARYHIVEPGDRLPWKLPS